MRLPINWASKNQVYVKFMVLCVEVDWVICRQIQKINTEREWKYVSSSFYFNVDNWQIIDLKNIRIFHFVSIVWIVNVCRYFSSMKPALDSKERPDSGFGRFSFLTVNSTMPSENFH